MSAGSSWQQFSNAVPPERGAFPLDFAGLCNQHVKAYIKCLRDSGAKASACNELSKLYLQCRMKNNLMEKEDLKDLGFKT